ncbi:hypothetical protein C8F04DRAFT_1278213 [Mycena alexandri]|uniref:RING-type domain-containing protein n=1 Tax=Mycena alexandri TaxID=1745969 RepID=A0AAD6RZC6_9AGAR|nr:hypothetical protein C8F04DRAFT_1278213 [Mycena alexandri]
MEYNRAHLYQTSLRAYFNRAITPAVVDVVTEHAQTYAPPKRSRKRFKPRRFDADAGRTLSAAIDVDEWADHEPIDVDVDSQETSMALKLVMEQRSAVHCLTKAGLFACPICADTFHRPVVTLCMHIFCDYCITKNFAYSKACPLCRSAIMDVPMRDKLFEQELRQAIASGLVVAPTTRGRKERLHVASRLIPNVV